MNYPIPSHPIPFHSILFYMKTRICIAHSSVSLIPKEQSSWGQHGSHMGPVGSRWAPCWPHEPCYQGSREGDQENRVEPLGIKTWGMEVQYLLRIGASASNSSWLEPQNSYEPLTSNIENSIAIPVRHLFECLQMLWGEWMKNHGTNA